MTSASLRIATRKSPLAIKQSEWVRKALLQHYPDTNIELIAMMSQGDKLLATPLAEIGGKGLFIKELEKAIMENRADLAVHSIKDMPVELPDGLCLTVVCKREDPRDVFVSNRYAHFSDLPEGAVVGTCSLRRTFQLRVLRPDVEVRNLRGNVGTRINKLDAEEFDAIVLAAAGLKRLGLEGRITHYFEIDDMLPAVGQGALGIESRGRDESLTHTLSVLDHFETAQCVSAERALSQMLGGSCTTPMGVHAVIDKGELVLKARVGTLDAKQVLYGELSGVPDEAEKIGQQLGKTLLHQGADAILGSRHS